MKLKNKTQNRGLTTGPHMSVGGPAPSSLPFPRHGRRAARPTRGSGVPRRRGAADGAGPRPGRSGDAGARVRAAGACSGAARGGAAAARAAVAPVWNGERVGEGEGLAGKLTAGSVWAEGG